MCNWLGALTIGGGQGPSCSEKWAKKTMIFIKTVLTSVLGQLSRYSQNLQNLGGKLMIIKLNVVLYTNLFFIYLLGCLKSMLCVNHDLTEANDRRWWYRASYQSVAWPRRHFFVWKPVWNKNLLTIWTESSESSSASGPYQQFK